MGHFTYTYSDLSKAIKMYDDSRNNYHSLFCQKWDGTPSTDMKKLKKIYQYHLDNNLASAISIIDTILDKLITDVQIYGHNPELRLKQKKYFLTRGEKMTTKTKAALEELKNTVERVVDRTENEEKAVKALVERRQEELNSRQMEVIIEQSRSEEKE